jgi:hypothetical protein
MPTETTMPTEATTRSVTRTPREAPRRADTTRRSAALWAGLGYVAIFVLAIGANFGVRTRLVDLDDPAATVANLAGNESLVRMALAGFAVIFVLDIVVAWALYVVLRPEGPRRSLLAAWLRLGYTVLLGVAVTFLYLALGLATGDPDGLDGATRGTLTILALDAFDITWLVGLLAFGAHLLVVGRIMLGWRGGPRVLGAVLAVAGAAYVVDTVAHLVLAGYAEYADLMLAVVAVPSIVAELSLAVWLLTRARRLPERGQVGGTSLPARP